MKQITVIIKCDGVNAELNYSADTFKEIYEYLATHGVITPITVLGTPSYKTYRELQKDTLDDIDYKQIIEANKRHATIPRDIIRCEFIGG